MNSSDTVINKILNCGKRKNV